MMGDFNTYFDFEYPLDWATSTVTERSDGMIKHFWKNRRWNPCADKVEGTQDNGFFRDVVAEFGERLLKKRRGFSRSNLPRLVAPTFSNFNDFRIGDPTRADRILYRGRLSNNKTAKLCAVIIDGGEALLSAQNENELMFNSDHKTVIATFDFAT